MSRRKAIPNETQTIHANVHLSQKLLDELLVKYPDTKEQSARIRKAVVDGVRNQTYEQPQTTGPNYEAIFKDCLPTVNESCAIRNLTVDEDKALIAKMLIDSGVAQDKNPFQQKYSYKLDRALGEYRELVNLGDRSDEDILVRMLENNIRAMRIANDSIAVAKSEPVKAVKPAKPVQLKDDVVVLSEGVYLVNGRTTFDTVNNTVNGVVKTSYDFTDDEDKDMKVLQRYLADIQIDEPTDKETP